MKTKITIASLITLALLSTGIAFAAQEEQGGQSVTVKGEVLDMACYTDHGASGAKHADCAKNCIASDLPVGTCSSTGINTCPRSQTISSVVTAIN